MTSSLSRPKKGRVLHIITTLGTGGAETMLWKLLAASMRGPHEHHVLSLMDEGTYGERIRALGVPVSCLRMPPTRLPSLAVYRDFRRAIRRHSPDLVQGWMYHGNTAATLAAMFRVRPIPCLWNIRQCLYDIHAEKGLTALLIRAGAWSSRLPKAILYNSALSASQHEAFGYTKNKTVIVPNGFDLTVLRPDEDARQSVRHELGIADQDVVIGKIARYHPMKDHRSFLEAAHRCLQGYPEAKFVLVGRGCDSENVELTRQVQDLGLRDAVRLVGERRDVPRVLAAFDITTSTSCTAEGFSNAIGEGACVGSLVVATDVGDAKVIVGDTGFIVPSQNPSALADAWGRGIALGSEGRRELGRQARDRMHKRFSIGAIASDYNALYEQALRGERIPARGLPTDLLPQKI